jgi:hypothetical protein
MFKNLFERPLSRTLEEKMENRGLLFIPDISGFTRFVTEMEIEHSRHIIQELLEILIDANHLGLEISEIEGDAILFYKFGASPDIKELYRQVEKMFCAFHRHLKSYEYRRICQCKACNAAIELSLKVITHYGEFTGYNIKNFYKLIGKDVIVAHQLLKNNIEQHEYWLITKSLLGDQPPAGLTQWMKWNINTKETESGEISFHYTQLSQLKNEIPLEPSPQLELSEKVKMISASKEYETDIKTLFYTTVHFELRSRWQEGVKTIDEVNHFLPGIGTKHRHVLDNKQIIMYTSSFSYDPAKRIVFSETEENRKSAIYFILEKSGPSKTKLTLDFYLRKNWGMQILFNLIMKKKLANRLHKSLLNLDHLVREIRLPVEF